MVQQPPQYGQEIARVTVNINDILDVAIVAPAAGEILIYDGATWRNQDLTGDVTITAAGVTAISPGVIVDADISAIAQIAVSKLADGTARQLLQTDAAGTGVEWTSNVDVPGTLDVTGVATFDTRAVFAEGSAGAAGVVYLVRDNAGDLTLNALNGKGINFALNGVDEIQYTTGIMAFQQATMVTIAGDLTLAPTGDIILNVSSTDQIYRITDRVASNALVIQGTDSGNPAIIEIYSADGDGSDDAELDLWGLGTPTSVANRERFIFAYRATGTKFIINTDAAGTGTARNMEFQDDGTPWMTKVAGGDIDLAATLDLNTNTLTDVGAANNNWTATGITTLGSVAIGVAGSDQGTLTLAGLTSGVVTIAVAAAAGTWTMTLPTAVGTAGFQLTDAAGNGVTSWQAAGSRREWKNLLPYEVTPRDALDRMLGTRLYPFTYKDGYGTGDYETEYLGPLADETPWVMHFKGGIFNPINAFGYTVLGIQALHEDHKSSACEIESLKARIAELEAVA